MLAADYPFANVMWTGAPKLVSNPTFERTDR
jgi:hypothetical protein